MTRDEQGKNRLVASFAWRQTFDCAPLYRDRMERPTLRASAPYAVLAVTLLLGLLLKEPCSRRFDGAFEYETLCYTDIVPLYSMRDLDQDTFPYVDHEGEASGKPLQSRRGFLEYPVLTGMLLWSAAILGTLAAEVTGTSEGVRDFFFWNVALLTLLAFATLALLRRLVPAGPTWLYFAAAPSLALYAFHNWDLLAVFFTVAALVAYKNSKIPLAGVLLALGASAKLYPALLAPVLAAHLVGPDGPDRTHRVRMALKAAGAFLGTLAVVNVPFLLRSPAMFLETYRFHWQRPTTAETAWFLIGHYGDRLGYPGVHAAAHSPVAAYALVVILLGILAWLAWRVARGRLGLYAGCLAVLLVFLLGNKVYSAQYALWILPLLPLAGVSLRAFALWSLADVAVYITLFPALNHRLSQDQFDGRFDVAAIALLLRLGVLAGLLVWLLRRRSHDHPLNKGGAIPPR